MHGNSMILMQQFVERYGFQGASVVDVGSYDVNGTYRGLFSGGKYTGADIRIGPNVDVIMDSPEWQVLTGADAVICGQTLEHVADIPVLMTSIFDVLKPGGLLCMIAPSAGPSHDYPIWVGLFSVERMTETVISAGFEIIDCTVSDVEPFRDCCCVARKPEDAAKKEKDECEDQ